MDMGMVMDMVTRTTKKRKSKLNLLVMGIFLMLGVMLAQAFAEEPDRKYIPIKIEDVLRTQAMPEKKEQDLNERLRAMAGASRFSQDYLLGPGDIIEVTIFGIEDLNKRALTLDSEGKITLPFLNTIGLIGLTPRESEVKIAALYEASVIKNPQVSVSVKEYRSQFFNVLGAVSKPGYYQLTRRVFLLDALAMAGGLMTEKADPKVFVHRAGATSPTPAETVAGVGSQTKIEIDLEKLLVQGDASLNIPIYAGDVISVPEKISRFYYVLGDVNRGGAFEIKRGESITLTKALAAAGGFLGTARKGKSVVIRKKADGATEQIPIDAAKVLKGKEEDIVLADNDVVFIPGSTTKMVGRTFLNGIGGLLNSFVIYGIR
jgi:polysaccharide biosynthesis/export protein